MSATEIVTVPPITTLNERDSADAGNELLGVELLVALLVVIHEMIRRPAGEMNRNPCAP